MIAPFLLSVAAGAIFIVLVRFGLDSVWGIGQKLYNAVPTKYKATERRPEDERVQVLVLGDIGRSPRMQYHAISLVKMGLHVDIIGYKGSSRIGHTHRD
jgi:beta-1,4-mannosyltransferase